MPTHTSYNTSLRAAAASSTAFLLALVAAALLLPSPVAAATSVCTFGCLTFFTTTGATANCCEAAPGNTTSFSPTYNTCWDNNGPFSDANCTVLAAFLPFPPPIKYLPPAPPPPPVAGDCGTLGCTFEFKNGNQTYHCCTGTTGVATVTNECPSSDPNCNGGYPLPINMTCLGGPKAGVGPWTDPLCGALLPPMPPSPPPYPPPSPPSPPPRPPPTSGATLATPAGSAAATRFWSAAIAMLSMLLVAGAF